MQPSFDIPTSISFIVYIIIAIIAGWGTANRVMGEYKNKINNLEDKVKNLENDQKNITKDLIIYNTKLEERTTSYASTLIKRKSPVSLSEKGEELLKRSGSDKFVLENKDDLIKLIRSKNIKSVYDVQAVAREVIESLQNDDRFIPLKNFAFKEGIEIESIFLVMSLYLRDIALPLLGYTPDQIDKDDPGLKKS